MVGVDGSDQNALVAQRGITEQGPQRVDQRGVGAKVAAERVHRVGVRGGPEVGEHVATAEGVDGLFRVADQDHRGVTGEGASQHVPLHRVGVLKLVYQHDLPTRAHPIASRAGFGLQHIGELGQQIVVTEDATGPFPGLHRGANRNRETISKAR